MDEDLQQMTKEELIEEAKSYEPAFVNTGIAPVMSYAGEKIDPKISVPEWPEFMKGSIRYRQSLEEKNL